MNPFIWKLIHLYIRELLYPILLFPTNRSNISNREESHFIFSSDRFVQISLKISLIKEILLEYEIFKKKEESKGLEILDVDSNQRLVKVRLEIEVKYIFRVDLEDWSWFIKKQTDQLVFNNESKFTDVVPLALLY